MAEWDLDELFKSNPDLAAANEQAVPDTKPKSNRTSASQSKAYKSGASFEEELIFYHDILHRNREAVIHKTGPLIRWLKDGRVVPTGPGPCDWVGVLSDRTSVWFESKSIQTNSRLYLPKKSMHQLVWLLSVQEWACSFYIVRWGDGAVTLHRPHDGMLETPTLVRASGVRVETGCEWLKHAKEI